MKLVVNETDEYPCTKNGTFYQTDTHVDTMGITVTKIEIKDDSGNVQETYDNPEILYSIRNEDADGFLIGWRVKTDAELENKSDSQISGLVTASPNILPDWTPDGFNYIIGNCVTYNGKLYRVINNHTSQSDWTPDKAVSLYVEIAMPCVKSSSANTGDSTTSDSESGNNTETYAEFKKPTGAQDAYAKGTIVLYSGKEYESLIDGNVWSPDEYAAGWKEITT